MANLIGTPGNDTVIGTSGADTISGGDGDDSLTGGDGYDHLYGGLGNDTLDGGSDGDEVHYDSAPGPVNVDLGLGIATGAEGNDQLLNISNVYGGSFGDTLTGDASINGIYGLGGDDSIFGGSGDDLLIGGLGNDRIDGGAGRDYVYYLDSSSAVTVNLGLGIASGGEGTDALINIENVRGSAFADNLIGDDNGNFLHGQGGNDVVSGGAGDDTMEGGAGSDTLDGGVGKDWVYYATSSSPITVNLSLSLASGGAGNDTLAGFENIYGGKAGDLLIGDAGNNVLYGGKGNDTLVGGDGTDTASYTNALDNYAVSYDIQTAQLSISDKTADRDGLDLVSFVELFSFAGVSKTATELISLATDLSLVGSSGRDSLIGGIGNDRIEGLDGDDILAGGLGNDTLDGGAGLDTALFTGSRSQYAVATGANGLNIQSSESVDAAINIERLKFSDTSLAFDLADGNAGAVARILGLAFGSQIITNQSVIGIGLCLMDGGMSSLSLMQIALDIMGADTNEKVVNLILERLNGATPTAEQASPLLNMLSQGELTRAGLGLMYSEQDQNAIQINLTGLQTAGLEYIPFEG